MYKKGHVHDTNNYRGVSVCDISNKLYSSIIKSRLEKWVKLNNITGEYQTDFMKDDSTVDHNYVYSINCYSETIYQ